VDSHHWKETTTDAIAAARVYDYVQLTLTRKDTPLRDFVDSRLARRDWSRLGLTQSFREVMTVSLPVGWSQFSQRIKANGSREGK
jgi:hypothetical protein